MSDEMRGLLARVDRTIATMINDDETANGTEARRRHFERYETLMDVRAFFLAQAEQEVAGDAS